MKTRTRTNIYSVDKKTYETNRDSPQSKRMVSMLAVIFFILFVLSHLYTSEFEKSIILFIGFFVYIFFPLSLGITWVFKPMTAKNIFYKLDTFIHLIYVFIALNICFALLFQLGLISGVIISLFLSIIFFHSRNNPYVQKYHIKQAGVTPNVEIKNYNHNLKYHKINQYEKMIKRKIFELYFAHFKKNYMLAFYASYILGYFVIFILASGVFGVIISNIFLAVWSILVGLNYYRSYKNIYNQIYSPKNNFIFVSQASQDMVYNEVKNSIGGINYVISNNKHKL